MPISLYEDRSFPESQAKLTYIPETVVKLTKHSIKLFKRSTQQKHVEFKVLNAESGLLNIAQFKGFKRVQFS